jgi:TM2 domain-containing membrane protein YozV
MSKILVIIAILVSFISHANAKEAPYQINDKNIDALFSEAQEVSGADSNTMNLFNGTGATKVSAANPNPVVATILAMPWLGVGVLGIHRLYLGTETGTFLAYLFTLGGCGVISLVDFIVLVVGLIEEDISQYVDNPKFIMWAN